MFKIEPSTEIISRREFPLLCNARKFWQAVEVGTDQGVFARDFLEHWNGTTLFTIDPYEPYWEMGWDREADRQIAISNLSPFADRVRMIRLPSPAAIAAIPKRFSIEFVYIDGAHEYEPVKADMEAWWNKLYPKGPTILAGHDFDEEHEGVRKAVTEFAKERDLQVRLSREGDTANSWYIYRNEPEELIRVGVGCR